MEWARRKELDWVKSDMYCGDAKPEGLGLISPKGLDQIVRLRTNAWSRDDKGRITRLRLVVRRRLTPVHLFDGCLTFLLHPRIHKILLSY